jgi:predicted DNA-binding transcriptional regulator AlpA
MTRDPDHLPIVQPAGDDQGGADRGQGQHDRRGGPETSTPAALTVEQILQRLAERLQPAEPPSSLIDAKELARLLSVSLGTLERMKAANDLPAHIVLSGNCHRWDRGEIERWIAARCPPRREWEGRAGGGDRGRATRA